MSRSTRSLDHRQERRLLVALNAADSLPRETAVRLARRPAVWLAGSEGASEPEAAGVKKERIAAARAVARSADRLYRDELRLARAAGAVVVTRIDDGYPPALRDLELPPSVLYTLGRLPAGPAIAIVGSRDADVYGLEAAERLASELAAAGLVVVSGFAVGVDGAAHRGALAGGGPTVAVLGCGVDVVYPRAHRRLRGEVARRGALVSEFRMGTSPEPHHFPVRNRLIAALSVGTLVVRAAPRSGSLITARLALELGRQVWAVPGNIFDRRSIGTNSLIRDGAHPVQEARDVLESLPLRVQDRLAPPAAATDSNGEAPVDAAGSGPMSGAILEHLPRGEPIGQDRLIAATGLPAEEVVAALLRLELDGLLRRYPGPSYCRRP